MARPAGRKIALVMTAVIGLGLLGAQAQYAAASGTAHSGGHTASNIETLAATTNGSGFTNAKSLFAASNPYDWCSLGAQLPANFSGYCEIGPDQIFTNLGTGNCGQVRGAPEDAEIDGTAVAIDCPDQGGIAEGGGYMGMPTAGYGNKGGPGAICIWAIPTAATNVMEGDQGQNPAILTIGSDASAAFTFNGLTVDAPAGSVPLDTWTELCGYTNSVFGGTQYCIMLDDYTSCDSAGQNLVSYDENFTQNIQTLWGYGYWMSSAAEAVNEPPTYAMYGSSGCPGLPSAKCVAISDPSTGTSVLPALCGSPGTISADSAGDCTWANLPAFWFAVISAEERAAQKPLSGGPIRSPEEPAYNQCLACSQQEQGQNSQVGRPREPGVRGPGRVGDGHLDPGPGHPAAGHPHVRLPQRRHGRPIRVRLDLEPLHVAQPARGGRTGHDHAGGGSAGRLRPERHHLHAGGAPGHRHPDPEQQRTWTFTRQAQDTYTFSSTGQLISETDLNGYTTTFGDNRADS